MPKILIKLFLSFSIIAVISCNGPHLSKNSILIKNVTIINAEENSSVPGQTILVEDGVITHIIPAGAIAYAAVQEVEAKGWYAIPGKTAMMNYDDIAAKTDAGLNQYLTAFTDAGITLLVLNITDQKQPSKELVEQVNQDSTLALTLKTGFLVSLGSSKNDKSYLVSSDVEIVELPEILAELQPDIVLVENAEPSPLLFEALSERVAMSNSQLVNLDLQAEYFSGVQSDSFEGTLRLLPSSPFNQSVSETKMGIEVENAADFVLLGENPLNTPNGAIPVHGVITKGRLFSLVDY